MNDSPSDHTTRDHHPHSVADERAARLRHIRDLAHLTRDKLCKDCDINKHTYKSWELARHGGLTESGAKKVVERVRKEGVICSIDWLLNGGRDEPYTRPRNHLLEYHSATIDQDKSILHEINEFLTIHPDGIHAEILDDALQPDYQIGDFVAGIRRYNQQLQSTTGHHCIVQTDDGRTLVRHVKSGSTPTTYILLSTNLDAKLSEPILHDVSLVSAAPIIRHYKKDIDV